MTSMAQAASRKRSHKECKMQNTRKSALKQSLRNVYINKNIAIALWMDILTGKGKMFTGSHH